MKMQLDFKYKQNKFELFSTGDGLVRRKKKLIWIKNKEINNYLKILFVLL